MSPYGLICCASIRRYEGYSRLPRDTMTMAQQPLALTVVHAHLDDEAIGSGGRLVRYAADSLHTILITCTLGEEDDLFAGMGDGA